MQQKDPQLADWAQQLAGLVILASCAAMATSAPKPRLGALPSVQEPAANPAARKSQKKKGGLSPEVQEFMRLPLPIQRQVLDYARKWLIANFERAD